MDSPAAPPSPTRPPLPTQPTALLGREADLAGIRGLLAGGETRLLTIVGPGGIGKTRLAVAAAEATLDDYPGGTWFVDLSTVTGPDLVFAAVASSLGVRGAAQADPREALATHLASAGAALLVLDNFEHLQAAAPCVDALLAGNPDLTILVTSREPLRLRREHVVEALPLAVPDPARRDWTAAELLELPSVVLFLDRATAADSAFALGDHNADAVAELLRRLDGLPLAIEFAASRTPMLPPAALVERMNHSLSLLRWDAPDLPTRQRTLRATLDWSHDLLSSVDRAVFRRLAVFAGGFGLDAVADTVDADGLGVDALDAVASLAGKQLVRVLGPENGEPRFRMLETVREYALERLGASGEEAATRGRHMLWFLALAQEAERNQLREGEVRLLHRLVADRANLEAALDWAVATGGREAEWGFAAALWPMWASTGSARAAAARFEAMVAGPRVADASLAARGLRGAGLVAELMGDGERAVVRFEEALAVAREAGLTTLTTQLLGHLAISAYGLGRHEHARRRLAQMLELAMESSNPHQLGMALTYSGLFAIGASGSDDERARVRPQLAAAVELLRAGGNRRFLAPLLAAQARLEAEVDPRAALTPLREGLLLARGQGDPVVSGLVPWMAAVLLAPRLPPARVVRLAAGLETLAERAASLDLRPFTAFYGSPADRAALALAVASARAALGHGAFGALEAQGRSLGFVEVVDEALALVDAAEAHPDALPDAGPAPHGRELLSGREREVLALVAAGRSNPQIADVLFLSPNTIKSHVTSLLNKLGADTRAQVVAIAAERGLL